MEFEFDVFGAGAAHVRVKVNAIGDFWHQRFGEADDVILIVIFHEHGEREAPGVGGVIVSAVVVDSPVHELQVCVGAVSVEVKEIGETHFAEAKFEAAFRKFAEEGVGSAIGSNFLVAERNDLVPHEARHVGSLAERGIADHVEVEESGDAESFAEPVAAGFLDIAEELGGFRDAQTGVESEHARTGVLGFRSETVFPLVRRMKRGMPLGDEIRLAGEPDTVPLGVGEHDQSRIVRRSDWSVGGGLGCLNRGNGLLRRERADGEEVQAGQKQSLAQASWRETSHIHYSELIW